MVVINGSMVNPQRLQSYSSNRFIQGKRRKISQGFAGYSLLLLGLLFTSQAVVGAVLPEDRADLLYHSYDGGGAEVSGPSLLVRKKFNENISATVNHYVDNVSSASVDVISRSSPYTEKRTENSVGLDFLSDKTLMNVGFTESIENDFDAFTFSMGISQDFFGDLSTLSLSYAQGDNTVKKNGDDTFSEDVEVRNYRLSLSQVITKDLILAFTLETITDEGYLNNPYRSVRYLDSSDPLNPFYQDEVYPRTRTSNSVALRGNYFLPYRATLNAGYRYFSDSWGIEASTYELGYIQPYGEDWVVEFTYRFYDQTRADFYSDLFPYVDAQNFLARDKEMSTFTSQAFGFGANYEFKKNGSGFIKRSSINLNVDYILFDYADFRDDTVVALPGEEPLYSFNATVIRFFISAWF